MKTPENPKQEVIDDARRLAGGGASLEMILMFFRERGFDKIDSINAIRSLHGKSMAEAKDIVDHSDAWSDRFRRDMEFRETAWKALRDIAASQDPSLPKIVIEDDTTRSDRDKPKS
jgi:ribosomal protein L7/L12